MFVACHEYYCGPCVPKRRWSLPPEDPTRQSLLGEKTILKNGRKNADMGIDDLMGVAKPTI